jgi:hypothetical protein
LGLKSEKEIHNEPKVVHLIPFQKYKAVEPSADLKRSFEFAAKIKT